MVKKAQVGLYNLIGVLFIIAGLSILLLQNVPLGFIIGGIALLIDPIKQFAEGIK